MTRLNFLKSAVVTASAVLVLSSCEDKGETNKDNPRGWLLESISVSVYNALSDYNYQTMYDCEYDSLNRFTRFTTSPYNGTMSLNYNADGDLVGYYWIYQGRDWVRATFPKNGNIINFTIEQYLNRWSHTTVNGELELNTQGLPVKVTSESECRQLGVVGGDVSNWSNTVTLTWQNGNLIKTEWVREDEQGSSTGTKTYTYDNKRMPFYHCKTQKLNFWLFYYVGNDEFYGFNENNIKTETGDDGSTITYEYSYNDDGFPVTRTCATAVGTVTETYTYK